MKRCMCVSDGFVPLLLHAELVPLLLHAVHVGNCFCIPGKSGLPVGILCCQRDCLGIPISRGVASRIP